MSEEIKTLDMIENNINKVDGNPRDFTADEIKEVSTYIQSNIPFSVLQQVFPLTENPTKKVQAYTIMYRMLNSAKNYTEGETRRKLEVLLEENKLIYSELYLLVIKLLSTINFGRHRAEDRMHEILSDFDSGIKINRLIDIFLIFAEKQTFVDTDRVTGIEIETAEGRELYKKINSNDESGIGSSVNDNAN